MHTKERQSKGEVEMERILHSQFLTWKSKDTRESESQMGGRKDGSEKRKEKYGEEKKDKQEVKRRTKKEIWEVVRELE